MENTHAIYKPIPAPTAKTSDCGMIRASHCRKPNSDRMKNNQLGKDCKSQYGLVSAVTRTLPETQPRVLPGSL